MTANFITHMSISAQQWSFGDFSGPTDLKSKGMPLPSTPGVYIITSGQAISHIGTSNKLLDRIRTLANLGTHRGSAEVLCVAHCTKHVPQAWWKTCRSTEEAKKLESALKTYFGEPPYPQSVHLTCKNGSTLVKNLVGAAGVNSWEAGYISAIFSVGEKLQLIFEARFQNIWSKVGYPAGPWKP